ncbi:hypothetical protein RJT34_03100 [Clitoria ternatea]|uniref:Uncharacterized protein n=1 Tax=Clitoria ternatea TaxID=43366 RepID=A0AAN9KIB9_CLITE
MSGCSTVNAHEIDWQKLLNQNPYVWVQLEVMEIISKHTRDEEGSSNQPLVGVPLVGVWYGLKEPHHSLGLHGFYLHRSSGSGTTLKRSDPHHSLELISQSLFKGLGCNLSGSGMALKRSDPRYLLGEEERLQRQREVVVVLVAEEEEEP